MIIYGGRGAIRRGSTQSIITLGDTWALHFENDEWVRLSDGSGEGDPAPRSSHTCSLVNPSGAANDGGMLVFGGSARSASTEVATVVADVWHLSLRENSAGRFQPSDITWSQLQPSGVPPSPRFDHSSVAYRNGLLVYGGCLTSTAFDDIWLLEYTGAANTFDPSAYAWRQLHSVGASPSPFLLMPPSPPATNASSTPPSSSTALASAPADVHDGPGARCAHSAVALPHGMAVFGGRVPLPPRASYDNNDPAWRTLQDAWVFDVERALQVDAGTYADAGTGATANGWESLSMSALTSSGADGTTSSSSLSLNRSDHSCILSDGNLMVFGGLFTDVPENTIYILKDFVNLRLPQRFGGPTSDDAGVAVYRLPWGPAWRFDHTMVVAPSVPHPDPRYRHRTLTSAPLLYGGGGGMEIFGDTWVYDRVEEAWFAIDANNEPTARVTVVTSMLFGTVGIGLYMCVIMCVVIRRAGHSRTRNGWPPGRAGPGGIEAGGAPPPAASRGAPADTIARLPRESWGDVVKCAHADCSVTISNAANVASAEAAGSEGGTSQGAGSMADTDEDEHDLCAVCLCTYEPDDVLIRLPCNHLFHERCVARWLSQDSSCPQCRFQLMPTPTATEAPPTATVVPTAAHAGSVTTPSPARQPAAGEDGLF